MKILIFLILVALGGCAFPYGSAHAQEISRADILATVRHIQALAVQQKQALLQAKQEFKAQGDELTTARAQAASYKDAYAKADARASQAEKERDSLIWIFSLACGMASLGAFRQALQILQMPWQLFGLAGIFATGFAVGFMIGRWALRFLAEFTPHLPF